MTIFRTTGFLSAFFFTTAVTCGVVYRLIGSHIDTRGVLHEPFFLIPLGWLSLALGLMLLLACVGSWLARRNRRRD
ncbi:DUF3955 domain-containing protein [Halomonas nitroreducens]|uniref:DUF3955 domain-containing protein n=1 Tax=Halomonas nitroreducens TaxID=447425 RepID=A0A431V8F4_9GAMM|nr:DUF3955 domain-containing protein [Halomonas nitroreducens]RTR06558.1 DUF3955 domain-containing protein [Halomonas nitroreducens]